MSSEPDRPGRTPGEGAGRPTDPNTVAPQQGAGAPVTPETPVDVHVLEPLPATPNHPFPHAIPPVSPAGRQQSPFGAPAAGPGPFPPYPPAPPQGRGFPLGWVIALVLMVFLIVGVSAIAAIGFVLMQRARLEAESAARIAEAERVKAQFQSEQMQRDMLRQAEIIRESAAIEDSARRMTENVEQAMRALEGTAGPPISPEAIPGLTPEGGLRLGFGEIHLPVSVVDRSVRGEDLSRDGAVIHKLTFDEETIATLVPAPIWSADGERLYLATSAGGVLELDTASLTLLRQITIDGDIHSMTLCSEGLAITGKGLSHLLVLGIPSLEQQRELLFPNVGLVVGSSASPVVFIQPATVFPGAGLQAIDIEESVSLCHVGVGLTGPTAMTPDGASLFLLENGALVRYAVERRALVRQEASPPIVSSNPQQIAISPDSRLVAAVCEGGNVEAPNHRAMSYGAYLYDVGNLNLPTGSVESGPFSRALGIDPAEERIYASNQETTLRVYTLAGEHLQDHALAPAGDEVRFFSMHPQGGRLLAVTGKSAFWIDFRGAP